MTVNMVASDLSDFIVLLNKDDKYQNISLNAFNLVLIFKVITNCRFLFLKVKVVLMEINK